MDPIARGLAAHANSIATGSGTLGQKMRRAIRRGQVPPTLASAPTIGPEATSSTLTTSYAWNSASLTPLRANWTQVGANPRAAPLTVAYDGSNAVPNSGLCGGMGSYFFITDAPKFEVKAKYDAIRVYVDLLDGRGWQNAGSLASGASGTDHWVPVDWSGSRAFRAYRIDFGLSAQFYGIITAVTDTVYPYTRNEPLKGVLLGDSFVEGTGATYPWLDGYGTTLSFLLGVDDLRVSGSGGTGLLQTNGSRVKYRDRIAHDLIAQAPDFAFIQISENDDSFSSAALQAEMTALVSAVKSGCSAKLAFIGIWNGNSTDANAVANNAALTTTAASLGVDYIDWYSFITGTGKVGGVIGDGNADFYVAAGASSPHPSDAGHLYRAKRLVSQIQSVIQTW